MPPPPANRLSHEELLRDFHVLEAENQELRTLLAAAGVQVRGEASKNPAVEIRFQATQQGDAPALVRIDGEAHPLDVLRCLAAAVRQVRDEQITRAVDGGMDPVALRADFLSRVCALPGKPEELPVPITLKPWGRSKRRQCGPSNQA